MQQTSTSARARTNDAAMGTVGHDAEDPQSVEQWARAELLRMRGQAVLALREMPQLNHVPFQGDDADRAAGFYEAQQTMRETQALQRRLVQIDNALAKIDRGEYGLCEATGEEIPCARLRANPLARYTVEHQEMLERNGRLHAGAVVA